jgi:hypothetical protein
MIKEFWRGEEGNGKSRKGRGNTFLVTRECH